MKSAPCIASAEDQGQKKTARVGLFFLNFLFVSKAIFIAFG